MEIKLDNGQFVVVSPTIIDRWINHYEDNEGNDGNKVDYYDITTEANPNDPSVISKKFPKYVYVVDIKQISRQFIQIKFKAKNISSQFKIIVFDDSIVEMPDGFQNYISYSLYLTDVVAGDETIAKLFNEIDKKDQIFIKKIEKLKVKHRLIRDKMNELTRQERLSNIERNKNFLEMIDNAVIAHQENLAYRKELKNFLNK